MYLVRSPYFGKKLNDFGDVHICKSSGFHNTLSLKPMWAKKKSFKRKQSC